MALNRQPARGRLGPSGVADRLVVLLKPGNAGGGKGPDLWRMLEEANSPEIGFAYQLH